MGQRGPKPKHPALKLLAGNPGRRPAGAVQRGRRVKRGEPSRPPELTGEAGAEWDRIAGALDAAGLLAEVDRGILAAYCYAVADMHAARAMINQDGRLLTVPIQNSKGATIGKRVTEHPAVRMLDRASARVQKLAADLGLSAASRSRLEGEQPAEVPAENKAVAIRERIQQARAGG